MASKGTQRINATAEFETEKVVALYKDLKNIITENSSMPFKDVIFKIAQINVGTFYNYIYPGNQMGQVSLYTVENLSKYFNLPKEIFTSKDDLTEEIKEQIASKIRADFGTSKKQYPTNVTYVDNNISPSNDNIIEVIKNISIHLNNENSIETLEQAIKLLEISLTISNNRLNSLMQLKNL